MLFKIASKPEGDGGENMTMKLILPQEHTMLMRLVRKKDQTCLQSATVKALNMERKKI